jgi:Uma2 family endonuclease
LVADHEVDLAIDPPPDLVVKVDITHTDMQKNGFIAKLGVPEFWRFNGREWTILSLVDGHYSRFSSNEVRARSLSSLFIESLGTPLNREPP